MAGAVVIALVMVFVMPIGLFVAGAVWAAIVGFFSVNDAEERYADSEYLTYRTW